MLCLHKGELRIRRGGKKKISPEKGINKWSPRTKGCRNCRLIADKRKTGEKEGNTLRKCHSNAPADG